MDILKFKNLKNNLIEEIVIYDNIYESSLGYKIVLTDDWKVKEVYLKNDEFIKRKNNDLVYKNQNFVDIDFVDISISPLTNSLPINHYEWEFEMKKEFKLLYINLEKNEVSIVKQRYTKIDDYTFLYESNNFKSEIYVNDQGFVIDYPNLFRMM